jgi:hypothetical protein
MCSRVFVYPHFYGLDLTATNHQFVYQIRVRSNPQPFLRSK